MVALILLNPDYTFIIKMSHELKIIYQKNDYSILRGVIA